MRVAVFSTKPYDSEFLGEAAGSHHDLTYLEPRLTLETAPLAAGFPAVCLFVNDRADRPVLAVLAAGGTRFLALRSAGFNHVDLEAARDLGLSVARVPRYSPHAVAEHTVGLMLALDRKIHRAYGRVREGNFSLDGLLGKGLQGRTVGIVGTGQIGTVVARILAGFECRLLAHDRVDNEECRRLGVEYVDLARLLALSEVITLHCPLNHDTFHLIGPAALERMRAGVMLINTSRGALVDTPAVIDALKEGRIGSLGLDVYEEEGDLFFEDLSNRVIRDDVFSRLLTFPNVIVTGHQAFFTTAALAEIAAVTVDNLSAFERGDTSGNELVWEQVRG